MIQTPFVAALALVVALGALEFESVATDLASSTSNGPHGGAWILVLILLVGALVLVRSRLGRR